LSKLLMSVAYFSICKFNLTVSIGTLVYKIEVGAVKS
jgi:hypothetical protein